jgi:DNA anti-recombination protein RmuC
MVLRRILEESGLKEGREYHAQVSRTNGQGKRLRQIEMLRELGAENSKDLPDEMEKDLAQADLPKGGDDGAIASSDQPGGNHSAGDNSAGDHSAGHQPGSDSPEEENSPE